MKRPLQLSLAITLALAGTNAMALGLGPVRVMSKLNQPLQAEIPVIQGSAGEAEGLLVSLADHEDFERLGISRSNLGVPLEFTVAKDAKGQVVIRVTSTEPVRSTYLDFLVEANWPKGRMLREYTVLLDPPMTAPAAAPAPKAVAAAPAASKPAAKPAAPSKPAAPAPVAASPKPAPAAPVVAPARTAAPGDYGPTQAGETLSSVAGKMRSGDADLNQTMLALLKHNPDAFYRNNINALKRGVILRAPSEDEIKAIGAASEAARQVHAQIEDWRGVAAATPRVASDTATPAPKASKPVASASPKTGAAPKSADQLELVPPKAGKDSVASAGSAGSSGSGKAGAGGESTRELARTKEALAASEQAATDLKSRVKDLEDLKSKNDRLISLKDSEIAELQKKLKELQSAKTAPATTKPTTTTSASAPIDKKDIWGDTAKDVAATPPKAGTESHPATGAKPETAAPVPVVADTGKPANAPASADSKGATTTTTPAAPLAGSATPGEVVPGKATTTPLADAAAPSTSATPAAPASTATASTPATTPPPAVAPTPKPAAPKPAAPAPKATPQPAWYEADWVMPAAIGGGVLVLLLGFLGLRKRKPAAKKASAAAAAPSIADSFGDSYGHGGGNVMESEIAHLQGQIAADPTNLGAHLELLSIYYAERNVERFEEAAERMHEHVADAHQPEWQEVQAMGEELAPHHPLWSSSSPAAAAVPAMHNGKDEQHFPFDDDSFADSDTVKAHDDSYVPSAGRPDFGFGMPPARAPEPAAPRELADHGFGFDSIPPLEDIPVARQPEPAAPAPVRAPEPEPLPADDFFSNEDAVGTKLDLARAYMDMGDPDGARSMLEEVLAEGNDTQKGEAQRLIADLR